MAPNPPKVAEAPLDPVEAQGLKVAKMFRLKKRLQGQGLDEMCKRYRERMIAKREQIVKDLPGAVAELNRLTGGR